MPASFGVKITRLPKLNPEAFNVELLAAARKAAASLDKALETTTASWEGDKPEFESHISLTKTQVSILPGMTGSELGINKWLWLNFGTKVRYAVLSHDWSSKTTPGYVGSGPGTGRVVKIDVNNPQPGIEAREWSKTLAKWFAPIFKDVIQDALAAGTARALKG